MLERSSSNNNNKNIDSRMYGMEKKWEPRKSATKTATASKQRIPNNGNLKWMGLGHVKIDPITCFGWTSLCHWDRKPMRFHGTLCWRAHCLWIHRQRELESERALIWRVFFVVLYSFFFLFHFCGIQCQLKFIMLNPEWNEQITSVFYRHQQFECFKRNLLHLLLLFFVLKSQFSLFTHGC